VHCPIRVPFHQQLQPKKVNVQPYSFRKPSRQSAIGGRSSMGAPAHRRCTCFCVVCRAVTQCLFCCCCAAAYVTTARTHPRTYVGCCEELKEKEEGTKSSVRPKEELSLSAETKYSAAKNHRIFGFGRIFGTFLYFRPKFGS
jgi:hypothetical protein